MQNNGMVIGMDGTAGTMDGTTDGTMDGTIIGTIIGTMAGTGNTRETHTIHGMLNTVGAELKLTVELIVVGVTDFAVDALKMLPNQLEIALAFEYIFLKNRINNAF